MIVRERQADDDQAIRHAYAEAFRARVEDTRARRRHHRRIRWALAAAALAVGALVAGIVSGGGGAGRRANGQPSSSRSSPPARSPTVAPKRPVALAVGPDGALYLADAERQQILRRLPDGRFVVVAGTAVAGYTGDGGRATQAELESPGSLAVAPDGAVFFVQTGRTTTSSGLKTVVVREVGPNGTISTVVGRHPSCAALPASSRSVPAQTAELSGAWLTIGSNRGLDLSTTVCPNLRRLGSFLRLTAAGKLVETPADSTPDTSGHCGRELAGPGFTVFGCASGARRGARLMVVRSNGTNRNYPETVSQPNDMTAANGTVVAIHNGAVVRIGADGLTTIATQRELAGLVSGTALRMGDNGLAVDGRQDVYVNQDFLVAGRGCSDAVVEIGPNRHLRTIWRSPVTRSCY